MVITQESTQSLAALNRPVAADVRTPREQQDIALPLVIPLGMEMFDIFAQGSPQGAVCIENFIRIDLVRESLNVGHDGRADIPHL